MNFDDNLTRRGLICLLSRSHVNEAYQVNILIVTLLLSEAFLNTPAILASLCVETRETPFPARRRLIGVKLQVYALNRGNGYV